MVKYVSYDSTFSRAEIVNLHQLARQFGKANAIEKKKHLLSFSNRVPENADTLFSYHEALLFILAYPDNIDVLSLAKNECKRIAEISKRFNLKSTKKDLPFLDGSGMNGTSLTAKFSLGITQYLAFEFNQNVSLYSIEGDESRIREFLQLMTSETEQDSVPVELEDIMKWLERESEVVHKTTLQLLMEILFEIDCEEKIRNWIFESLQIFIHITFENKLTHRSDIHLTNRNIFYQEKALNKKPDLIHIISNKSSVPIKQKYNAEELLKIARLSLLSLSKETDPITYAQEGDYLIYDMGEGIQIALFHMQPNYRLPLEIYAGYMAFRNGIPYSYGGAWCFNHSALIGINIYETYRGGESATMLCQLMRLYHHEYRINHFRVEPYQLGHNNEDGLNSGVFWFYYRLGFRPENAKLKKLAEAEWEKMSNNKEYRTSISVLRKLVSDYMAFFTKQELAYFDPSQIGTWVTNKIQLEFAGNRDQARKTGTKKLLDLLDIKRSEYLTWEVSEIKAFEQFSFIFQFLNGLEKINKKEQLKLISLMKAKGGKTEKLFLDLWQNNKLVQKCFEDNIE